MRDTVWSILLTQIPIAIACLWVALEMRGIRKGIEGIERAVRLFSADKTDDGGDNTGD